MFKYVFDKERNEEAIKTFPLEKGLAGYVVISNHTLNVPNVQDDTRFNKFIDDPKAPDCTSTK